MVVDDVDGDVVVAGENVVAGAGQVKCRGVMDWRNCYLLTGSPLS